MAMVEWIPEAQSDNACVSWIRAAKRDIFFLTPVHGSKHNSEAGKAGSEV